MVAPDLPASMAPESSAQGNHAEELLAQEMEADTLCVVAITSWPPKTVLGRFFGAGGA